MNWLKAASEVVIPITAIGGGLGYMARRFLRQAKEERAMDKYFDELHENNPIRRIDFFDKPPIGPT